MYYYRDRWYEPGIGFVERDPLSYTDSPSLHAFLGWQVFDTLDPLGQGMEPIGWVYWISGELEGNPVEYAGSARFLKSRFSGHHWKQIIRASQTRILARPISAELNVAASGRGTFASAVNEALRAPEQDAIDRAKAKADRANATRQPTDPETTVLNKQRAARDPELFRSRHRSTASRWRVIKASGGPITYPSLFVLMILSDAWKMTLDDRLSRYTWGAYTLEDSSGVFTFGWDQRWWIKRYYKTYVSGAHAGERVEVVASEYQDYVLEAEALWGTVDRVGAFVPGLFNTALPVPGA
jgi:hypothetical protein